MAPKNAPTSPNWIGLIHKQICRYYPNDERPAKSKVVAVDGPMLKLAIQQGIRGWDDKRREPLTIQRLSEMRESGSFKEAVAFADFKIDDEESGAKGACVWLLSGKDTLVQFISPGYEKLQAQRALDIESNKIRRASKKPKLPPKPIADRTDTL